MKWCSFSYKEVCLNSVVSCIDLFDEKWTRSLEEGSRILDWGSRCIYICVCQLMAFCTNGKLSGISLSFIYVLFRWILTIHREDFIYCFVLLTIQMKSDQTLSVNRFIFVCCILSYLLVEIKIRNSEQIIVETNEFMQKTLLEKIVFRSIDIQVSFV